MKKNENGIIKYHNDLADIPLTSFSANHANIFMVTCYRYQKDLDANFTSIDDLMNCPQEEIPKIRYDISDFIKLCNYKKGGPKKFAEEVRETKRHLGSLHINVSEGEHIEIDYPFFYEFKIDKKNNVFEAQIHKRAAYMLFGLERNYTKHEIDEFVEIKSVYAKRCYRMLKKWRTVGFWETDINEFKTIIGIPDSYKARDINKQVISVIEKELSPYFQDLNVEKIYGSGRGKPIKKIRISFQKEPMNTYKKTSHICPSCGKPLVEKVINGKVCWCHSDGWKEKADCHAIYNSIAEIKGYGEENDINDGYVYMPEEIKDRLSKMF